MVPGLPHHFCNALQVTEYFLLAVLIVILAVALRRSITIFEHERGLLFNRGKFVRTLQPGKHTFFRRGTHIEKVDVRVRHRTIPGQELITADGIALKATLVAEFEVTDPYLASSKVAELEPAVYLAAQLALRDIISAISIDDALAQRGAMSSELLSRFTEPCSTIGVTATRLEVKDLMLPGDLKRIFAAVAEARHAGQASLERARSEAATMRSLANTSKMLREHPELLQMRVLEAIDKSSGNTFVLGDALTLSD